MYSIDTICSWHSLLGIYICVVHKQSFSLYCGTHDNNIPVIGDVIMVLEELLSVPSVHTTAELQSGAVDS